MDALYIAATGLITPLGADLDMTSASVEAGLNIYADSPYLSKHGVPVKMALIPESALPPLDTTSGLFGAYHPWHKHLLKLAAYGIKQALQDYTDSAPIPLILNLPEPEEFQGAPLPNDFMQHLVQLSGGNISAQHQRMIFRGRAGAIEALALAEKLIFERGFTEVIIGGVDSYQLPTRLRALEENDRLAGETSLDGFTPGEGACFLLLSKNKKHARYKNTCLFASQIANEPGHLYSNAEYSGEGLAMAVNEAMQNSQSNAVTNVFVSANGERYWAKELGTSLIRNQHKLTDEYQVLHPAEYYGDLGAASAATLLALAAHSRLPGQTHMICASSDSALRGAVLLGEPCDTAADTEAGVQSLSKEQF